jgi:hypothetical protein
VLRGTRVRIGSLLPFRLQGCHLLWLPFPRDSAMVKIGDSTMIRPTTPITPRGGRFRLFPVRSPLLGESRLLSFPAGTEMVQFPALASPGLCIQPGDTTALPVVGCPIRKSPDYRSFAPTRGLSQLTTSFIACLCQGIHRAPLVTWPKSCSTSRLGTPKDTDTFCRKLPSVAIFDCQRAIEPAQRRARTRFHAG